MMGLAPASPAGGRRQASHTITQGSTSAIGGLRSHGSGNEGGGAMAKAVVVHGISTNRRVSGVVACVGGIMG